MIACSVVDAELLEEKIDVATGAFRMVRGDMRS